MRADEQLPGPVLYSEVAVLGARGRAPATEWWLLSARKLSAYVELTKPRITLLIVLVAMGAYWLGSRGAPDRSVLLRAVMGVCLLAAGIFALNQYLERDLDAIMRRTEGRPLPTGRLKPGEALGFGVVAAAAAVAWLAWQVNAVSGLLALFTLGSYLFLYTPLKKITPHCTFIGAFPGATPPLFGWAAARGELGLEAWALFGILFLWQFPHFHSIAWTYREDYARAGVRMWPVVEPEGHTASRQIAGCSALLLPASLLPGLLGVCGPVYLGGAALLGGWLLWRSVGTARRPVAGEARRLLLVSVLYLPALFGLMVLDYR